MPPAYRRVFANIGLDGYAWQLGAPRFPGALLIQQLPIPSRTS